MRNLTLQKWLSKRWIDIIGKKKVLHPAVVWLNCRTSKILIGIGYFPDEIENLFTSMKVMECKISCKSRQNCLLETFYLSEFFWNLLQPIMKVEHDQQHPCHLKTLISNKDIMVAESKASVTISPVEIRNTFQNTFTHEEYKN